MVSIPDPFFPPPYKGKKWSGYARLMFKCETTGSCIQQYFEGAFQFFNSRWYLVSIWTSTKNLYWALQKLFNNERELSVQVAPSLQYAFGRYKFTIDVTVCSSSIWTTATENSLCKIQMEYSLQFAFEIKGCIKNFLILFCSAAFDVFLKECSGGSRIYTRKVPLQHRCITRT